MARRPSAGSLATILAGAANGSLRAISIQMLPDVNALFRKNFDQHALARSVCTAQPLGATADELQINAAQHNAGG